MGFCITKASQLKHAATEEDQPPTILNTNDELAKELDLLSNNEDQNSQSGWSYMALMSVNCEFSSMFRKGMDVDEVDNLRLLEPPLDEHESATKSLTNRLSGRLRVRTILGHSESGD